MEVPPFTFLFKILSRYYWKKSTSFQGIHFTKVSTKWPQIHYVDAAFEVPSKDTVYLIEGNIHGNLIGLKIDEYEHYEYC